MTPLYCEYCKKRIRRSKEAFDERYELRDDGWHHRAWHRDCDPFTIELEVVFKQ